MAFLDMRTVETKKLDSKTTMTVSENLVGDRLFIEVATNDGKYRLEKNFPVTALGTREAQSFQTKIKSYNDLLNYFGFAKEQ